MQIRIGTRTSKLAVTQTHLFIDRLKFFFPQVKTKVIPIRTTGDILYDQPLSAINGKSLFIKEIEESLLSDEIDVAVHSMKDMPIRLPVGLTIAAVLEREDSRDAFLSMKYKKLSLMPKHATLGTCSSRRKILAARMNQEIIIQDLRGNVETRIRKMEEGEVDALILAVAGLKRINLAHYMNEIFPAETFLPSPCQGIICVECKENNKDLLSMMKTINHLATYQIALLERKFANDIESDCKTPVGIHIKQENTLIKIQAFSHINNHYKEFCESADITKANDIIAKAANLLK